MVYRKGELSRERLNRDWPHQVALRALGAREQYDRHELITEACKTLSHASRGHCVFHDGSWWYVHCFANPEDAATFMHMFGGEPFDPRDQGGGKGWSRWDKGKAVARDVARRRR